MKFSDIYIRSLKSGPTKYYKREANGFTIKVWPSGSKTWVYVYTFEGKRKELKLGEYPAMKLADARKKYNDAYEFCKNGIDPGMLERQQQHELRIAPTVKFLVNEYLEKHAKPKKRSWREDQRCLEKEVIPVWGDRKARDIRKRDVIDLLDGIVKRGSPVMANNTFEKIRKMFNFALAKDILEFSPCFGVEKPTKKEHKERVLSDKEITIVWNALETAAMSDEIKRALKVILVTGQRPGEVIGMHSSEIEDDWWTVPPERAKNGKAHRVYLTPTAKELIGNIDGYIFESPRKQILPCGDKISRPMDVNAIAYAVRRNFEKSEEGQGVVVAKNLYQEEKRNMKKTVMDSWTPHDLRRTAATNMSALEFSDEIIDAVLNHVKKGVIAIYNRYKYDKEKKAALEAWEMRLREILSTHY